MTGSFCINGYVIEVTEDGSMYKYKIEDLRLLGKIKETDKEYKKNIQIIKERYNLD